MKAARKEREHCCRHNILELTEAPTWFVAAGAEAHCFPRELQVPTYQLRLRYSRVPATAAMSNLQEDGTGLATEIPTQGQSFRPQQTKFANQTEPQSTPQSELTKLVPRKYLR